MWYWKGRFIGTYNPFTNTNTIYEQNRYGSYFVQQSYLFSIKKLGTNIIICE